MFGFGRVAPLQRRILELGNSYVDAERRAWEAHIEARSQSHAAVRSDLELLKEMLTRSGRQFRTWKLRYDAAGNPFDGDYVAFGTEGDYGPYTEFTFDVTGSLVLAESVYSSDTGVEAA